MAGETSINFPPFDPDLEPTTTGIRFNKYSERFKNYLVAIDVKDKARKHAIFLHCVQDIFDRLEETGEDLETACKKLQEYFEPKKHTLYNIYKFRQIMQEVDKSYDDYCTRLKLAAQICEFPEGWQDTEIQLQLIEKGKSKRIRRQFLSKQPTLKEALNIATAQEIADNQASRIESRQRSNEPINDEVNKLTKSRHLKDETKVRKMNCYSGGGVFPHEGGRTRCPAFGKKCSLCEKYNHHAKFCRSGNNKYKIEKVKTVNVDSEQSLSSSNEEEAAYNVEAVGSVKKGKDRNGAKGRRPIIRIKIEDHEMAVLIDTGSTVNVMDEHTYRKNFARTCKLRKNRSVIHSYHTLESPIPPLKIIGKIDTVVESEEKIIPATFYVVEGCTTQNHCYHMIQRRT